MVSPERACVRACVRVRVCVSLCSLAMYESHKRSLRYSAQLGSPEKREQHETGLSCCASDVRCVADRE